MEEKETKIQNKKSKTFWARAGILSLACVLVTTAVTGITLAKYIRQTQNTTQTATVASFVTITWTDDDMFESTYATDLDPGIAGITNSVIMTGGVDGIAPGTLGESIVLYGANSEVAYTAQLDLNKIVVQGFTVNDGDNDIDYQPVLWTVKYQQGDSPEFTVVSGATIADLMGKATEGIYTIGNFNAGTAAVEVTFSWEWAFESYYAVAAETYDPDTTIADNEIAYAKGDVITKEMYDAQIVAGANITPITPGNWRMADLYDTQLADKSAILAYKARTAITDGSGEYVANAYLTFGEYNALTAENKLLVSAVRGSTPDHYIAIHNIDIDGDAAPDYAEGTTITVAQYNQLTTAEFRNLCAGVPGDPTHYLCLSSDNDHQKGEFITKAVYDGGTFTASSWEAWYGAPMITFSVKAAATQID